MRDGTTTLDGPAAVQADLWGERARDWADVLEGWSGWGIPLYRHALERVPAGSGTGLLDVGCGAGRFCRGGRPRSPRSGHRCQQVAPAQSCNKAAGPALHEEGVLDTLAMEAGLTPKEAGYLPFREEYPNLATMLRGYMAAALFVRAMRASSEHAVREALTEALRPLETSTGRYRLEDEVRYLIAIA